MNSLDNVHLQVALDLVDIDKAVRIAELAYKGGADFVEAGTPLIKSHGVKVIHKLKKRIPDATIVADMKTIDAADVEVSIAAENGADIVTVLALSSPETLSLAIDTAHDLGCKIMVDLMNVDNTLDVGREAIRLGADYLCLHVGVDVQRRRGITAEDLVNEVSVMAKHFPGKIAVAGGINAERAKPLVKAGASIIIVGGAIIKAKDPEEATKIIRKAIEEALTS